MTTNYRADNRFFVFMASKVTTKMYCKRLKMLQRVDLPFCEEEIGEYTGSVKDKNSGKKS